MAHTSEFLDYTVNAFIVKNAKVLLIYNKTYNSWFGPGGHIERDEDIESALFREIKEETGIKKDDLKFLSERKNPADKVAFSDMEGHFVPYPSYIDLHRVSDIHQHVAFRYFLATDKEPTKSQDENVTEFRWFNVEDLDSKEFNLRQHVIFFAKKAIERASK